MGPQLVYDMIECMTKDSSHLNTKILIRAPDHIGDCVMALPALAHLQACLPQATLYILAQPPLLPLLLAPGRQPAPLPPSTDFSATLLVTLRLRREGYHAALLLKPALRAALKSWGARIPVRLGYADDGRRLLLTDVVQRGPRRHPSARVPFAKHCVEEFFDLAQRLAARLGALAINAHPTAPQLPLTEAHHLEARRVLSPLLRMGGRPLVGLHLTTHGGETRTWSLDAFLRLAQLLQQRLDIGLVLLGGPEDGPLLATFERSLSGPVLTLGGEKAMPLLVYAALTRLLNAYVVADTGPMHLAAAAGARGLALLMSTDPNLTGPFAGALQLLRGETVPCWPCYARHCQHALACHQTVDPERVLTALLPLLASRAHHV